MVAPPGNQAANGENKPQPVASGETGLLDSDQPFFRKDKMVIMISSCFIRIMTILSIFLGGLAIASGNASPPPDLKLNNLTWTHH